jgi:arylsulfatase A-like enzyme
MQTKSRPNILIFMVDEMQNDVTRTEHPCHMPHLKKFAEEGITFTNAFTCSPHCCPSRATFMSGAYPTRHGIFNNVDTVTAHQHGLTPGVRLFSEDLREAGYEMAIAGKWHVSHEEAPADRGWEEWSEYHKNGKLIGRENTVARYNQHIDTPLQRAGWGDAPFIDKHYEGPDAYRQNWYYEYAIKPGMQALERLSEGEKPWCLFVSTDMEGRSSCPREYYERYDQEKIELPVSFSDTLEDKPNIYRRLREQIWGQLSTKEVKSAIANYWANCEQQDAFFGELLDTLEKTGEKDNTLVLFISDHGDYNFSHGLQYMGIPSFREAYHIPAVIRWPSGLKNSGRKVDEFVSIADFAPTFIELADATLKDKKTGRSLKAFLADEAPEDWTDAWFSQTKGNEVYYTQRIVSTKIHKYVYNAFDFDELYDLENDPHEMVNLIHPSRHGNNYSREQARNLAKDNPWPHLPDELNVIRKDMLRRMWQFALEENDSIFSDFTPCAISSFGPMITENK